MRKNLIKSGIICGLLLAASTASAGEFGIGAYGSKSDLSGKFNYLGTDVDTGSDLNMTKKDSTVIPTLFYKTKDTIIYVDYIKTRHKGSGNLNRTITFDDRTFTVGTNVSSEISMDWGRLGFRTDATSFGTGDVVTLNLGADLHFIKLDASIDDGVLKESKSVTFGLPTIGAGLEVRPVKNVALFADVAGMSFGSYGHYLEFDTGVKVDCPLIKGVEWKVGYKSKEFDLESEDNEKANLEFKGAYAGLSYSF